MWDKGTGQDVAFDINRAAVVRRRAKRQRQLMPRAINFAYPLDK
ncbi:hypothetical protein O185_05205 [Photorhabdus temperata J3]|uniref:Uncharacterized protein n=1 Tax=Photorhabdus temperata J3 TaxID=1389415 RepID=U7R231_PHOTE|nr:hypothetical protein O185_05205 [Photorhabdus temperata J3]